MKKWIISGADKEMVNMLIQKYHLPTLTAVLLAIRGITEGEDIEKFFSREFELSDPFLIKDMDKAVKRIKKAVTTGEKICIYGDYDCDGVTATALLYLYLESVFANVMYYIPDRNAEGYGMNLQAVEKLKQDGIQLIVTVDNGISAIKEIDRANELGIDVVVTDHHKPQDILPKAVAVVNPHRTDDDSPYEDFCGAGLALKLAMAMEGEQFSVMENYGEIAAIGTVADLVPLTGENRTIVKAGLQNISNTERVGLASLIEVSGIDTVNAGNIGFRIAPRINAAGRLGTTSDALDIFTTEDMDDAQQKAKILNDLNAERQSIELDIFNEICDYIKKNPEYSYDRVIVVSSENWNAGVIGIVSSRVTEMFGKPSIIISESGEICKGSGRSVSGFSIVDAVFACSEYLEKYGGHPMAMGFSIKKENIEPFRKAINDYANKIEKMPLLSVKIDCKLNPEKIFPEMVKEIQNFEPFGYGNSKPVFALCEMRLDKIIPLKDGKHLKLAVSRNNARLNIMKFFTTVDEFPYSEGDILDFAVCLETNVYQGVESISFNVREIKLSGVANERIMYSLQEYDKYKSGILTDKLTKILPTRENFAAVYKYILATKKKYYFIDSMLYKIHNAEINAFKLLMILEILNERGLIEYEREFDRLKISVVDIKVKVNLQTSPIYIKLKEDISHVGEHT